MKEFNKEDLIKLPEAFDLIKEKPWKYVSHPEFPALDIVSHLMADALSLLARKVIVQQVSGWYLVSADKDWVRDNKDNIDELSVIFSRFISIPEKGVNSFRGEVLVYAFSNNCFVYENQKICIIKGDVPPQDIIDSIPSELTFSVCFSIHKPNLSDKGK